MDGTVEDARSIQARAGGLHRLGRGACRSQASRQRGRQPSRCSTLDGVNTFYGKSHILNDVSLDVREHEVVALLGRNGAGKSTLLKSLVGIAPPASGSIKLAGDELAGRRLPRSRASASVTCLRVAACSPA